MKAKLIIALGGGVWFGALTLICLGLLACGGSH